MPNILYSSVRLGNYEIPLGLYQTVYYITEP